MVHTFSKPLLCIWWVSGPAYLYCFGNFCILKWWWQVWISSSQIYGTPCSENCDSACTTTVEQLWTKHWEERESEVWLWEEDFIITCHHLDSSKIWWAALLHKSIILNRCCLLGCLLCNSLCLFAFVSLSAMSTVQSVGVCVAEFIEGISQFSVKGDKESKLRCK